MEVFARILENAEEENRLDHGLEEELVFYAEAQKTSLPCEFGFGSIRRSERGHLNGKMVPATAFHSFSESILLPDFGLPPAPVTLVAKKRPLRSWHLQCSISKKEEMARKSANIDEDVMRFVRLGGALVLMVALLIALYFIIHNMSLVGFVVLLLVVCVAVVLTWRLVSCRA